MARNIKTASKSINGQQRAWIEAGSGPVVLLLHGFPDAPTGFTPQIEALAAAGFRAIAPYSRGNAPSFIPDDDDHSPVALATDVRDFLDGLSIPKAAAVIGHDWGAITAYVFAALAPNRLDKLVTLSVPHGRTTRPNLFWSSFVVTMQLPELTARMTSLSKGKLVKQSFHYISPKWDFTAADLVDAERILGDPVYLRNATGVYRSLRRWPLRRDANFKLLMKSIDVPTLCFAGVDDRAMNLSSFKKMSEAFTSSFELVELKNVGHFPHRECPELVTTKILEFIGSPDDYQKVVKRQLTPRKTKTI